MRSSNEKCALPVMLLITVTSVLGQTYQPKSITFSGCPAPPGELLAATALPKNSAISQAEIQAAAQRLSETGLFADVRFKFDGQELHFDLKPADNKLPAQFDNFPWWKAEELETKLESRVPLYHGALPPESGMQSRVVDALTALLAEQHITATVTAAQQNDLKTGKAADVAFRVERPSVLLGEVSFSGDISGWTDQLDAIAKAATGQEYHSLSTSGVLKQAVEHVYHNQGFLDAQTNRIDHQAPVIDGDMVSVPMSVSVTAGGQYHLGQLALAGTLLMTQDEFLKTAKLQTGDVAGEDKLRVTLLALSQPYRSRGYLHANVHARPTYDRDKHIVDYSITVDPGDIYNMGTYDALGLSDDLKALALKTWKMKPGDPYDGTYAPRFLVSNKEALHALNGYGATFKQFEHNDTHVVDVVFTFAKLKQQ